jgi:hypothetical protein
MDRKRPLIPNIRQAIETKAFPTVTMWNRQEGRPRTDNFKRALQAEIRDALWMLTRQWQLGEFEGDDAGTPVKVKVQISTSPFDQFKTADASFAPMPGDIPLETLAERKRIPMGTMEQPMHLDLRLQIGRHWTRLLRDAGLQAYVSRYRDAYGFKLPDRDDPGSERVYAHLESWQQYAAIAGRAIDGYTLYSYLAHGQPHAASDGIVLLQPTDKEKLDTLGAELQTWFDELYAQPGQQPEAWLPPRLEYQFSCAAAGEELIATEYYQDTPDWYVFDQGKTTPFAGGTPSVVTVLPTSIEFDGMPDTRWWAFEDRKTNFGNVSPSTTDLAKLLLMEFALVYANDWFIIPFRLPINAMARVDGLMVTNTFGETHWIDPSGSRSGDSWQRWEIFGLAGAPANRRTLMLPALTVKTQAGDPTDEVNFIRDEMANMVWGVESTIPLLNGYGRAGRESAVETRRYFEKQVEDLGGVPPELPYRSKVSYLAMTRVPEHWIPFLPVHVEGDNREIQLQRSKMLRLLEGDPRAAEAVAPRTSLLREGLDQSPKRPYFIHEEEVVRAGIRVAQSFQRTRWTGGEVYVWLTVNKQTGRGEGSSGLAFDQLSDIPETA